ncbi:MAG: hypothetical protein Q8K82_17035 [Gemmatimonadaceae bacterium]|nr:hypothetical protein [Gemmatimonadaceae bacterium]
MAPAAELTLLILRLLQGPPRPPLKEWFLFPSFVSATPERAREFLETTGKPVLVAPLIEPGCVGLWSFSDLELSVRASAERELANRREYFEAKLRAWPDGIDAVRLQEGDADLRVDLATFRTWSREYYVAVGHGIERDADARVARLTVRPPGGAKIFIGMPDGPGWCDAAS